MFLFIIYRLSWDQLLQSFLHICGVFLPHFGLCIQYLDLKSRFQMFVSWNTIIIYVLLALNLKKPLTFEMARLSHAFFARLKGHTLFFFHLLLEIFWIIMYCTNVSADVLKHYIKIRVIQIFSLLNCCFGTRGWHFVDLKPQTHSPCLTHMYT